MSMFSKKPVPDFFGLLLTQAELCVKGIQELCRYMELPDGPEKQHSVTKIVGYEKEADRFRKEVVYGVRETFITPFDREEIFILSRNIDDIIDKVDEIKDIMEIFRVEPGDSLKKIAALSVDSMKNLVKCVENLRDGTSETQWTYLVDAKKLGNQAKRLYWQSILDIDDAQLTQGELIQNRELMREMRALADKIGKTADEIGEVKLKMIK